MDGVALEAGFCGGDVRRARAFPLTVDNTLRVVTLGPGGWRLYGSSTQIYYETRTAVLSDGTLLSGETAPTQSDLVSQAAGSPAAGIAYGVQLLPAGTDAHSSVRGGLNLTTDPTQFEVITVPLGQYVNLYLATAASTVHPILEGPFQ